MNTNEWLLNKYLLERYEETKMEIHDKYLYADYWSKINELDSLTKTILRYKFNNNFDKKRTNREIADMLMISKETVRSRLNDIKFPKV